MGTKEEFLRQMEIERSMFLMGFGRDVDYHDAFPKSFWLDQRTGDVVGVYDDDDDADAEAGSLAAEYNRVTRERVAAEQEHYLEIPGRSHGEHHDILRQFLRSDWTDDAARRRAVEEAYSGSIGRWKREVQDEDAVYAFYSFREWQIEKLAEQFLSGHGIAVIWK